MIGKISNQEGMLKGIICTNVKLVGKLSKEGTLIGHIRTDINLIGKLSKSMDYDNYDGSYQVTPTADGQIIPTDDKRMIEDITINPIPYAEVSNQANGITVTIA